VRVTLRENKRIKDLKRKKDISTLKDGLVENKSNIENIDRKRQHVIIESRIINGG
jgi:hypothetical protein